MKLWVEVYESTLPGNRHVNADTALAAFDAKFPVPTPKPTDVARAACAILGADHGPPEEIPHG